jgi:phytoene/squalene synthetase
MKHIFDKVSIECSRVTTRKYSTSFSAGIIFLDKRLRDPVYSIYGFVRFADEIVDSFHDYDKKTLFSKFKNDTYEAIENRISLNPILNSFQAVYNKYGIESGLVDKFLESMEKDLYRLEYDECNYKDYITGSAEAVGLMCLKVFTENDNSKYEALKPYAIKLGSAFQKVNFLRDVKSDYNELGRSYFPDVNLLSFSDYEKMNIEEDIEEEFNEAIKGINLLPDSSKKGVYLSYVYYKKLFRKIKSLPAKQLMEKRVRVSNGLKLGMMMNIYLKTHIKLSLIIFILFLLLNFVL